MREDLARTFVGLHHREDSVQRVVVELLAVLDQRDQLLEQSGDRRDLRGVIAGDAHFIAAHPDADGRELLLDAAQELVARADQGGHDVLARHDHCGGRRAVGGGGGRGRLSHAGAGSASAGAPSTVSVATPASIGAKSTA